MSLKRYYDTGIGLHEPLLHQYDPLLQQYDPYYRRGIGYANAGLTIGNSAYRVGIGETDRIGVSLYHTVGDRERAIKQLSSQYAGLANDLAANLGFTQQHQTFNEDSPLYAWYHNSAVPEFNAWQAFQADQTNSFWTRWATSWETYTGWFERYLRLRKAALDAGFALQGGEPTPLPTTLFENLENVPNAAEHLLWTVVKWVLIGGVIIFVGVWALRHI